MDKADSTSADDANSDRKPASALRRGWTTGACATAATKAALTALLTGEFPDPVSITLPKGETPAFALAREKLQHGVAMAGIIKDAGDDPDATNGALIIATVEPSAPGTGISFEAGEGVGTVTKPGLPIAPGEAAINPVPRQMMRSVVAELCKAHGVAVDFKITISVPGGDAIAMKTWNPRLGIVGGISILGTTGIVHPFSCSAWIHSIHRGIDVCRANGLSHAIAATGSTSEDAANAIYRLPLEALLDMGDFAGGLLKYLRNHPIEKITLAGGFAKFTKLAQGAMDLHSSRSQVDLDWLSQEAIKIGVAEKLAEKMRAANTAMEALQIVGPDSHLPRHIAEKARQSALGVLREAPILVEVMVFDREGILIGRAGSFEG